MNSSGIGALLTTLFRIKMRKRPTTFKAFKYSAEQVADFLE